MGAGGLAWANSQTTSSVGTPAPHGDLGLRVSYVGVLVSNPGSDMSFQDRLTQTKLAWETFLTSPVVGVGPGYDFAWTDTSGFRYDGFSMDTPLIYLAKFGLIGLIPMLLFVAASLRLVLALWRRRQSTSSEFLTVGGYGIALGVTAILVSPMEDKGVAFALILLVGFGCRALIDGSQGASVDVLASPGGGPVKLGEGLSPSEYQG